MIDYFRESLPDWDVAEEELQTHIFPRNERHDKSKDCRCEPLLEFQQCDGYEVWVHFPLGGK